MKKLYQPQGRPEQGWMTSQDLDEDTSDTRYVRAVFWRLYLAFLVLAISAAVQ